MNLRSCVNGICCSIGSVAIALVLSSPGWAETPEANENADIELLFVQTSPRIEADTEAKKIRLVDVNQQSLYFSDRPVRVAGHIPMAAYMKEWTEAPDDFNDDPPNATLSVYEPGKKENSVVVIELLNPVVDGKDLVYDYNLIEGEMPKGGEHAALFIDRIGPGGGVGLGFHGVGVGLRGPGVAGWPGVAVRAAASE
ncbi:hypothetical protein [Methyloceanibacter methanicus]|nr:hypothetical protein [Methyloceanibacter methanicus]